MASLYPDDLEIAKKVLDYLNENHIDESDFLWQHVTRMTLWNNELGTEFGVAVADDGSGSSRRWDSD